MVEGPRAHFNPSSNPRMCFKMFKLMKQCLEAFFRLNFYNFYGSRHPKLLFWGFVRIITDSVSMVQWTECLLDPHNAARIYFRGYNLDKYGPRSLFQAKS